MNTRVKNDFLHKQKDEGTVEKSTLNDLFEIPEKLAPKFNRAKVLPKMSIDMEKTLSSFDVEQDYNWKEERRKPAVFLRSNSSGHRRQQRMDANIRRKTVDFTGQRRTVTLKLSRDQPLHRCMKELNLAECSECVKPRTGGVSSVTQSLLQRNKRLNDTIEKLNLVNEKSKSVNLERKRNDKNDVSPKDNKKMFYRSMSENDKERASALISSSLFKNAEEILPSLPSSSSTFLSSSTHRRRSRKLSFLRNQSFSTSLQERSGQQEAVVLPDINASSSSSLISITDD